MAFRRNPGPPLFLLSNKLPWLVVSELKIVDDLILLRCKEAISPAEVNLGTLKSGRLLLQEVNERVCREIQPDLDRVFREITGLHLVDICVGLFLQRREKIYLFTMTDTVKQ